MRDEYDFSKGECGKFYKPNATINLPVYLDNDVLNYFSAKAKAKGPLWQDSCHYFKMNQLGRLGFDNAAL